ncbi:MAG: alpha/beta hydrolase family protein [Vulcanimicrobiota bacterium]
MVKRTILLLLVLVMSVAAEPLATASRELEVEVAPGLRLGATLEYPSAPGTYPAVVLVHGSGPNDRDETMPVGLGVIRPFKELSHALAQAGVVVLRYDKRTFTLLQAGRWDELQTITPMDFVSDAQAALALLVRQPEVDPHRLFVFGHSQGGTLGPWVAQGRQLAGLVLLAPALLPMREQIEYQAAYQLEVVAKQNIGGQLDGTMKEIEAARDTFRQVYAALDSGQVGPGQMMAGASREFYLESDRLGAEVVEKIVTVSSPVLIVNGSEDLKCPERLLRTKADKLHQKTDLTIFYQEGMVHELYGQDYGRFDHTMVARVLEWMDSLVQSQR